MSEPIVQPLRHLRSLPLRGARARRLAEDIVALPASPLRRRLLAGSLVALAVLVGVAATIAWQQYDAGRRRALDDAHSRAVTVASLVDTAFGGLINSLTAAAASDTLRSGDVRKVQAYVARIHAPFTAGIGFLDRTGRVQAGVGSGGKPSSIGRSFADRSYFKEPLATGRPYVSEGVRSRVSGRSVFAMSVPVRDVRGQVRGVLVGSVLVTGLKVAAAAKLGYQGLTVIDRNGKVLVAGLPPASNRALVTRLQRNGGDGVVADTGGLRGGRHHAVAFARSKVSGWLVAIDRPRSAMFAPARRALVLDLAGLGGGVAVVLALLAWAARRTRADEARRRESVRRWGELTARLGAAVAPGEVAKGLADAVAAMFPGAAVLVALDEGGGEGLGEAALRGETAGLEQPLLRAARVLRPSAGDTVVLEREADRAAALGVGTAAALGGGAVVAARLGGAAGRGGMAVAVLPGDGALSTVDSSTVRAYAGQAAQAFERALLQQREHRDALTLQHGLLPDELPAAEGVQLAGHYRAGGDGAEIGGDWYDAVRRPDGTLCISVGDVVGHGIPAAVLMGRLRNAFRAYALDGLGPAEIMRRLSRHLDQTDMATALCVEIDPYGRTLAYSSAGHPPALLATSEGVARLDGAPAPPLGVAAAAAFSEGRTGLGDGELLLLYTDGLIERRGTDLHARLALLERTLDDALADSGGGIGAAGAAGAARSGGTSGVLSAERAITTVLHRLVDDRTPTDDVALVLAALAPAPASLDVEISAEPGELAPLRRRLRAWLRAHGMPELRVSHVVTAVAEALNNAIEHGTPSRRSSVHLHAAVDAEAGRLQVRVADRGSWVEARPTPERGRGILLMRGLMDEVRIEPGPDGTVVELVAALEGPATGAAAGTAPVESVSGGDRR